MMKRIITLILALSLLVFASVALTSCGERIEYDSAEKYTPGDWAQTVLITSIDIEWISGKVEILPHYYGYLAVSESSESALSNDTTMHWYYDGETLRIKPGASGVSKDSIPEKNLTVYVPVGYSFSDIDIVTSEAEVSVSESGANFVDIKTGSGKVDLQLDGKSQEISVKTISGEVTVSGSASRRVNIETVSASASVYNTLTPDTTLMKSVSGNITYYLDGDEGFTLKYSTESGSFNNQFAATEKNGEYIVGDGVGNINIETVSGNIKVNKKVK